MAHTPADMKAWRECEELGRRNQAEHRAAQVASPTDLPATVNWQLGTGQLVTAVKSQNSCGGASYAFGVTAMVESHYLIQRGCDLTPDLPPGVSAINLSEAALFFCSAPSTVNCISGWTPSGALDVFASTGVPDTHASVYPAQPPQPCARSDDWGATAVKIEGSVQLTDIGSMKRALTKGPVVAVITVYEDLLQYPTLNPATNPVYQHTQGSALSQQCLCVVGYDDQWGAWLCKTSWGATFGFGGYCWIGYGQCGIDAAMWGLTGSVLPKDPMVPVYRFLGPSQQHFYTTSLGEVIQSCGTGTGWQFENVRFYASRLPQSGMVPMYRLSLNNGDHFYTTDAVERANAIAHLNYVGEGIAFYVWPTAVAGTMAMYRLVKVVGTAAFHFYTTSVAERDYAIANYGYIFENIPGYVPAF